MDEFIPADFVLLTAGLTAERRFAHADMALRHARLAAESGRAGARLVAVVLALVVAGRALLAVDSSVAWAGVSGPDRANRGGPNSNSYLLRLANFGI